MALLTPDERSLVFLFYEKFLNIQKRRRLSSGKSNTFYSWSNHIDAQLCRDSNPGQPHEDRESYLCALITPSSHRVQAKASTTNVFKKDRKLCFCFSCQSFLKIDRGNRNWKKAFHWSSFSFADRRECWGPSNRKYRSKWGFIKSRWKIWPRVHSGSIL